MGMDRPTDRRTERGRSGTMTEGRATDAISLLTQDHRRVDDLFRRFEELGSGNDAERGRLAEQMADELTVHASIEEAVFYPAVRDLLAQGDELVEEALHEHQEVRDTLAELGEMEPGSARFDSAVSTLISEVRHHVNEEENEIFPKLRSAIGQSQLVELGRRLEESKSEEAGGTMLSVESDDLVVSMFEPEEEMPVERAPRPTRRTGGRKKSAAKRPSAKKAGAKRAGGKKSTAKRGGAKKSTKRAAAKKSTRKSPRKKSSAKRPAARKSIAKRGAKKSSAKRAGAKKSTRKKSSAKKSSAKKSTRRKSSSAGRKKSTARRKSSARSR
jgi:hemerythrin superfamily protein